MFETWIINENLETLHEWGIVGRKAENLARLEWVNKKYIDRHVTQAVEVEGQSLGLAIWRMEHGVVLRENQVVEYRA